MSSSLGTPAVPVSAPHSTEERLRDLEQRLAALEERAPEDRVAIVVFSGDLDRVLAAFVIATGAAAMGQKVSMFFTFWGLGVLKKRKEIAGKTFMQMMMTAMTPGSSQQLPVSKMNYFGMGSVMLRAMMKDQKVSSLEEMIALSRELGVRMIAFILRYRLSTLGHSRRPPTPTGQLPRLRDARSDAL